MTSSHVAYLLVHGTKGINVVSPSIEIPLGQHNTVSVGCKACPPSAKTVRLIPVLESGRVIPPHRASAAHLVHGLGGAALGRAGRQRCAGRRASGKGIIVLTFTQNSLLILTWLLTSHLSSNDHCQQPALLDPSVLQWE